MSENPLSQFSKKLNEYSHIGWIPCIAGRLNYNNASPIKALGNREEARGINLVGDGYSRVIAISSTHDWKDDERNIRSHSPGNVESEENCENTGLSDDQYNGEFKIIALGRAESFEDHCLFKIRVALVSTTHQSAFDNTQELFEKLLLKKKADRDDKTHTKIFEEIDVSVADFSDPALKGCYLVEALLHPNGLILCKHKSSTNEASKVSDMSIVVRQSYYYLKYIFHHHKHHRESDDCACTIIPIPEDHQTIGHKLVGDLTASVNQFRRVLDSLGQCGVDHMGIIGYIESMAKSCKRLGLYKRGAYEHQVERLKYVRQSFSAMVARKSMGRLTFFQKATFALQISTLSIIVLGTYCLLLDKPANNYVQIALVFFFVAAISTLAWGFKIRQLKRYRAMLFSLSRRKSISLVVILATATIVASIIYASALRDFFAETSGKSIPAVKSEFNKEPIEVKQQMLPEDSSDSTGPSRG